MFVQGETNLTYDRYLYTLSTGESQIVTSHPCRSTGTIIQATAANLN